MILALRTDTDEATIMLLSDRGEELTRDSWISGRELSSQLMERIMRNLATTNASWSDVSGIIIFTGPGSFTGLRIGVVVANTAAYIQGIPVVGTRGMSWVRDGVALLLDEVNHEVVVPEYGAEPNITRPQGKNQPAQA